MYAKTGHFKIIETTQPRLNDKIDSHSSNRTNQNKVENRMTTSVESLVQYTRTLWGKQDASEVIDEIGQGKFLPTQALLLGDNQQFRTEVVEAGAIDKILEFLLQSNKPFDKVLPDSGDVPCPSLWLQVISNYCTDGFLQPDSLVKDVQVRVLNNMLGVFQDMTNLEERKIFGSTDYWIKSLPFFSGLLSGLLTSQNKSLGDFLLKQESVKNFLVRVVYLDIGDPKVVRDIEEFGQRDDRLPKPDILGSSQSHCAFAIKSLALKRGRDILGDFAMIKVSPQHELAMGPGIIKLLETCERDEWYQGGFSSMMNVFLQLYDWGGRLSGKFGVDCVSSNLVSICSKYLSKHAPFTRDRFFFENVTTGIVVLGASFMTPVMKGNRQAPIDYNVAAATYNGLFEYCLDICDCNDGRLAKPLEGFLKIISVTAAMPSTKKAIRAREKDIRARLERIKDRLPFLFSSMAIMEQILDEVCPNEKANADDPASVDAHPSCEFCYERCNKGTTKKCSFCKSIVYCSSDCLQLNWMLHQKSCLLLRKSPPPKVDTDIVADGKTIFAKNVHKILLQASLKGFLIQYCFVVVDMAETTPLLRTLTAEQFTKSYILDDDMMRQSKETFERNKIDGSLTVALVGFAQEGLSVSILTFLPDSAPVHLGPSVRESIDTDRWSAAQREVAGQAFVSGGLEKIQSNPQLWKASLLKSMKP